MSRWATMQLGQVADVIRGVTFDRSEVLKEAAAGYTAILRAGNIGEYLDTHNDLVWVPNHRVSPTQLLRRGDVVICMSSGSADIVGKSAPLVDDWRGSVGAFCATVRFHRVLPQFGSFCLRSPAFWAWRNAQAKGVGIQNLRKTDLERFEVPVPDTPEQQQIVELLDQGDSLRRLRAQADERMASFEAALYSEQFGAPGSGRRGWDTVPFEEAFNDETARTLKIQAKDYADSGILPVVDQGQNFVAGYTSDLSYRCPSPRPFIVFGDHTRVVKLVEADCAIGADGAKVFTARAGFDATFLSAHLKLSPIPNLGYSRHMREVRRLRFTKPPLELQRHFAATIRDIQVIQRAQHVSRERLDKLSHSLLQRVFSQEAR